MWTILGKLAVGVLGLTALGSLLCWIVAEGFAAAGDASAIGGKPSPWVGLGLAAIVVACIVALVKG